MWQLYGMWHIADFSWWITCILVATDTHAIKYITQNIILTYVNSFTATEVSITLLGYVTRVYSNKTITKFYRSHCYVPCVVTSDRPYRKSDSQPVLKRRSFVMHAFCLYYCTKCFPLNDDLQFCSWGLLNPVVHHVNEISSPLFVYHTLAEPLLRSLVDTDTALCFIKHVFNLLKFI